MEGQEAGDDWGDIFAAALNGEHFSSPLGIADVALGNTAWSAKTVKNNNPVSVQRLRLVSGRNNVGYSYGNDAPLENISETGNQVLAIWNARVEEAIERYAHLRGIVLIRNMTTLTFKVFELPLSLYDPADYAWSANRRNNLIGTNIQDGSHAFTWQPNGSQFTIHRTVSGSARSFQIRKPPILDSEQILQAMGYSEDWVTLL